MIQKHTQNEANAAVHININIKKDKIMKIKS